MHGDNYHAIFSDTQLNTPNPIRSQTVRLDETMGLRMANETVGPNQNPPCKTDYYGKSSINTPYLSFGKGTIFIA